MGLESIIYDVISNVNFETFIYKSLSTRSISLSLLSSLALSFSPGNIVRTWFIFLVLHPSFLHAFPSSPPLLFLLFHLYTFLRDQ